MYKRIFSLIKDLYVSVRLWKNSRNKAIKSDGVIFFLPEMGIKTYTVLYENITKRLQEQNIPCYYTRCFNLYAHCLYGNGETYMDRFLRCLSCNKECNENTTHANFINLNEYISQKELNFIDEMINIKDLTSFEFEGIQVGQLCLVLVMLYKKSNNINSFNQKDWSYFKNEVRNFLINYTITKNLLRKYKIKNFIVINEYPSLLAVWSALKGVGGNLKTIFPTYHKNISMHLAQVVNHTVFSDCAAVEERWGEYKSLPLTSNLIEESFGDIIHKLGRAGTHIYSPTKTHGGKIKKLFLNENFEKTIVCFTSSDDEFVTSHIKYKSLNWHLRDPLGAFSTHHEWIENIIEYAAKKPHYQLIIRIHPRAGSEHRNKNTAEDLVFYKNLEANLPGNVQLIWPTDQISSYDLADIADLALIAWSTVGTEFSKLGIPVLSGIKKFIDVPNGNFIWYADNREKYFELLETLVNYQYSIHDYKLSHRWYCARYLGYSIDTKDSRSGSDLKAVLFNKTNPLDLYIEKLVNNDEAPETKAIKENLIRLISFLILGNESMASSIAFGEEEEDNAIVIKSVNGYEIDFLYNGKLINCYSSAASRFIKIYKEIQAIN